MRKQDVRFHTLVILLEKEGNSSKAVINQSLLANLLERYNESGFRPVAVNHSKHCLCGKGKGEVIVQQ
jgi:hypothetical protein